MGDNKKRLLSSDISDALSKKRATFSIAKDAGSSSSSSRSSTVGGGAGIVGGGGGGQQKQQQHLVTSNGIALTPATLDESSLNFKVLYPQVIVGMLIGRNGSVINQLSNEFKVKLTLSPGNQFFPNTYDKVLLSKYLDLKRLYFNTHT